MLVGGLAARIHGATRVTKDLDICPSWTRENLHRLASALRGLGAKLTYQDIELSPDAVLISGMEIGCWITDVGQVDVLLGIPRESRRELARYKELRENSPTLTLAGGTVAIAALKDVIRLKVKEIADREKDRAALPELRRLEQSQRQLQPGAALEQPDPHPRHSGPRYGVER